MVDEPQREIARRWRYAVAGEGDGWSYSSAEKERWASPGSTGAATTGRIEVATPSVGLRLVTVTLTVEGQAGEVRLATMISRI